MEPDSGHEGEEVSNERITTTWARGYRQKLQHQAAMPCYYRFQGYNQNCLRAGRELCPSCQARADLAEMT